MFCLNILASSCFTFIFADVFWLKNFLICILVICFDATLTSVDVGKQIKEIWGKNYVFPKIFFNCRQSFQQSVTLCSDCSTFPTCWAIFSQSQQV